MKLNTALGLTAAAMLAGTFCTFALCMVEDVDDGNIPQEYYYVEETEDKLLAEAEENDAPAETEITVKENIPEEAPEAVTGSSDEDSDFEQEAFPVAVTAVPQEFLSDEREPLSADNYYETEEQYPEDFDVDDYSGGSAEAAEQSVFGSDNSEDGVLYEEEADLADTEIVSYSYDEDEDTYGNNENEPIFPDPSFYDYYPDENEDVVITFFDAGEENAQNDVSVSVSVGDGSGSLTGETFTAKFNGSVQTVNAYDLICWIVNNEVSPSFSDEAIKAQAVASYSYVKYHNVNGLTPSVLVKKDPSQRIKDMVSSVWGVCCYYNGSVAQTVYMASSSGYTADAKNVWGGSIPYLKSVECPFDAFSDPNYGSVKTVSEQEMRSYLENALGIKLSDNPENWIRITSYVDGNYVSTIDIDGQRTISGRKMRENVFNYKLKSAAFDVYYSDGVFTFVTYGYGHGVGMSQNGANILAKQGYTYSEILKYYFTGIEVL